jgi:hypothetical protein
MKTRRFSKAHATIMEACGFWVDARNGAAQFHRDMGRKGTWLGKITLSPNLRFYQGEFYRIGPASHMIEATVPVRCTDAQLRALCALLTPGNIE